ncbi:hypothetical protein Hdeb2414_s0007g00260261 [Helianthus debilis subsp. tardiflorus]
MISNGATSTTTTAAAAAASSSSTPPLNHSVSKTSSKLLAGTSFCTIKRILRLFFRTHSLNLLLSPPTVLRSMVHNSTHPLLFFKNVTCFTAATQPWPHHYTTSC